MGGGLGGGGEAGGGGAGGGAAMGGSSGKVLPRKKAKLKEPAEQQVQPSNIRLTSLEQIMRKTLEGMNLPFRIGIQYPLGPYRTDFAIPVLKMAIDVDGAYWHERPEARVKDAQRDAELAAFGWSVMRFKEKELKERLPDVKNAIIAQVQKCWKRALEEQKKHREVVKSSFSGEAVIKNASESRGYGESEVAEARRNWEDYSSRLDAYNAYVDSVIAGLATGLVKQGGQDHQGESIVETGNAKANPGEGNPVG
jgi:very-short-patch-repair endonuclease